MNAQGDKVEPDAAKSGLLLQNGRVLDYFPADLDADANPRVETADLRIQADRIVERGSGLQPRPGEKVIDLEGVTVAPGNINAHGHLYAALAAGMPLPDKPLKTFTDILSEIWWPLDRALDAEAVYLSAIAGGWDAVRCGTTLIFDHHASLSSVGGSLDRIQQGLLEVGLRGCLCYETTDRGGKGQRDITLQENERFLQKLIDTLWITVSCHSHDVGIHSSNRVNYLRRFTPSPKIGDIPGNKNTLCSAQFRHDKRQMSHAPMHIGQYNPLHNTLQKIKDVNHARSPVNVKKSDS